MTAGVRVNTSGLRALRDQLDSLSQEAPNMASEAANEGARILQKHIRDMFNREGEASRLPVTGTVYQVRAAGPNESSTGARVWAGRVVPVVERAEPHQASAPGEVPHTDQGDLEQSFKIQEALPTRLPKAQLFSNRVAARQLQEGEPSLNLQPRPYIDTLIDSKIDDVQQRVADRVSTTLERVLG